MIPLLSLYLIAASLSRRARASISCCTSSRRDETASPTRSTGWSNFSPVSLLTTRTCRKCPEASVRANRISPSRGHHPTSGPPQLNRNLRARARASRHHPKRCLRHHLPCLVFPRARLNPQRYAFKFPVVELPTGRVVRRRVHLTAHLAI
jgi:hypothetical protein